MAKNILHIAMIFILLISISGVTIHKHYCHDELTDVSVFMDVHECGESSCAHCEDEVINCQLELELLSSGILSIPENSLSELMNFGLLPTKLLMVPETIESNSFSEQVSESSTLHGISMLQSFRC